MKKMLVLLGLVMIVIMAMVVSAVTYPTAPENFYLTTGGSNIAIENYFSVPDGEIIDWGVFDNLTGWREADIFNHTLRMRTLQSDENLGNAQMQVSAGTTSINETNNPFTFMTDINMVSYGISNETYGARFQGDSRWNSTFFQLRFRNDSYVTCMGYGGSESTPSVLYNENEWNTYKVVINPVNSLYSAWKNNELICENWSGVNGWDGYIETRFYVEGGAEGREVLWDNVYVFDGTTLPPNMGMLAGYEAETFHWNKSITNQSSIVSYCRMENDGMVCGAVPPEPAVDLVYQFQFTNTSGVSWNDMYPYNYSGCPVCPVWSGGYWTNETAFINSGNFSDGTISFRIRAFDGYNFSEWAETDPYRNCNALWNCTETNNTCMYDDHYMCLQATDISGCEWSNMTLPDIEYNQDIITNRGTCDFCPTDWNCTGYGSCSENNTQLCNAVTDINDCFAQTGLSADEYSGNFSEFTPQACDYCTPDWNCTGYSTNCTGSHLACDEVTDINVCGELYTGNYSEFTPQNCSAPPITGYVAQYGSGDLSKLIVDNLGEIILTLISMVGIVVLVVVIGWGAKKIKTGIKGR